jgi:hypothetical protein
METIAAQEAKAEKFEQWCIVELFGHTKIAGWVTEASIGGCNFIRVDVPKAEEEGTLYTRYLGNGAIYALNPTTKENVLRIVGHLHPAPPTPREPTQRALQTHYDEDDDYQGEDD